MIGVHVIYLDKVSHFFLLPSDIISGPTVLYQMYLCKGVCMSTRIIILEYIIQYTHRTQYILHIIYVYMLTCLYKESRRRDLLDEGVHLYHIQIHIKVYTCCVHMNLDASNKHTAI